LRNPADRVLLGEIGAAQGLKGEVRLRSYTAEPAAIARYGALEDDAGRAIEIESVRVTPKALVARIKGVTTRDGAARPTSGITLT
jgi:16S rRNA processing protein RimM